MIKLRASLEAVKSRKDVSDNILYSGLFSFFEISPSEIGQLTAHYKLPLVVTIEVEEKGGKL